TVCPSSLASIGLGSNVSTCDGPPFMNRKMSRLARGAKCGARGARGLLAFRDDSIAIRPASAKTVARPRAPNPPPIRQSTSRRDRRDEYGMMHLDTLVRRIAIPSDVVSPRRGIHLRPGVPGHTVPIGSGRQRHSSQLRYLPGRRALAVVHAPWLVSY